MEELPFRKWVIWAGIVFFGAIGGIVGHITREQQHGRNITYTRLASEALASGFVAVLVLLLCLELGFSLSMAMFLGGVFGYLGVTASIGVFNRFISKATPLQMPETKETEK